MTKTKSSQKELVKHLTELHLPSMRASYEEKARMAERESLGYEEYLVDLTGHEVETRREHRIERYLRESKLPLEKNLASFDMKRLPQKIVNQMRSLLEGSFLKRRENVLCFGNPGAGKTHLIQGICQELIRTKVVRILSTTCQYLVESLLGAKKELKLERALKKLSKYEAVLIDDIGYVQQNRSEMEVLFTLLSARYETGSIMITSNLPFSKWEKIFKDPMTTAAAIDRVVHHSVILELNLPSYRMAAAKAKKGLNKPKKKA